MDSLARKLVESINPCNAHSKVSQKFAFFAPSKVETKIDESLVEKVVEILSNKCKQVLTEKDEGIELEDSDYKSLKSYISFILSRKSNAKSTERLLTLFKGLDSIEDVSLQMKQNVLKLLLMISTVNDGNHKTESRPMPMPYSDGMPSFSVFSDTYFDKISPNNNFLFSKPPQLDTPDPNISMDSGVFSLPSLPNIRPVTNKDQSFTDVPYTFQSSLSNYSDISQYNLSTAFTTSQKESNPERFIRKRKKPPDPPLYISEAPPDLYARYILLQQHKHCLDEAVTVIKHPIPTPHDKLIESALFTLQGLDSVICSMDRRSTTLIVNEFITSETYTTIPLVNLFKKFAFYGSCFSRLEKLAAYLQLGNNSTIGKALGFALNVVLQMYLANVVNLSPPNVMPENITLLQLTIHFQVFFELLEGLGKIFKCLNPESNTWEPYLVSLPTGLDLLVYLEESTGGIIPTRPLHKIMCYLLTESNKPLLAYIQNWIFHGQILDPTNEFGLEANPEKLACRDEEFWTKGLNFKENFNIPSFLKELEETLLLCGKSLTLLRICDPTLHIINIQPYSELRMKLCPNKLVIREYRRYWNMYTSETIDYLKAIRKRESEAREFEERERKEAIVKRNEEKRRQSKELREKKLKIASERKQKLMTDLQAQIRDKQESRLQQLKMEKELDEYYAAKTGSILETGVEGSAPELVEEVKKEIIEKYAVLEQEAVDKIKLAEERKTEVAVKLGIIEGAPDDGENKENENIEEKEIDKSDGELKEKIDPGTDTRLSLDTPLEILPEVDDQKDDELAEKSSELNEDQLDSLPERLETLEIDKSISEMESIPTEIESEIEPVISPVPEEENFYFSLQKSRCESPLFDENPYRVISEETATEDELSFLEEHESFTAFPVSQLVKLSYLIPIQAQARLVNIFLLDYFRNTLKLDNHLTVLRKFVMLENGEFSQSLSLQIFNLLYLPESEQNCFLWYLHLILEKALLAARVPNLPQVENLVLGYKEQDTIPMVTSSSVASEQQSDQLSRIVLQFNVGWPLNIVFRSYIHNCYTKIFCFLMYVNRSIWCLSSVTGILKSLQERLIEPSQSALKEIKFLHLYRHEMQHFVTVLQYYLTNQVLKISWVSFQGRLEKVENIEELYTEHRNYVNQIMTNMALNTKGKPIYIAMKKIFFFIYQFFLRLQESHWTGDEPNLNNFKGLKEHYDTYKKFAFLLYKLISKLIANGYSSQLESFILSINFNEHYAQHNPLL